MVAGINAQGFGFTADKRYWILGEAPSRTLRVSVRPTAVEVLEGASRIGMSMPNIACGVVFRQQVTDPNSTAEVEAFMDAVEQVRDYLVNDGVQHVAQTASGYFQEATQDPYFDLSRISEQNVVNCELICIYKVEV